MVENGVGFFFVVQCMQNTRISVQDSGGVSGGSVVALIIVPCRLKKSSDKLLWLKQNLYMCLVKKTKHLLFSVIHICLSAIPKK